MNATQSLALTRFVRATCPQQKFDEYTPDAWFELLNDLQFTDCHRAAVELGKRQPFISPAEIRTEVRRIRSERIKADMTDPEYPAEDVPGGIDAIRRHRKAIGDGEPMPPAQQLPKRDVRELIESTAARLPKMPKIDQETA